MAAAVASVLASPLAYACSRVAWNNDSTAVVCGRTLDWSPSLDNMLFTYRHGLEMDSRVEGEDTWTSIIDCTNKVWYFDWTLYPNITWVDLKAIDFAEVQPMRDLNTRNPSLAGEDSRAFEPVKNHRRRSNGWGEFAG